MITSSVWLHEHHRDPGVRILDARFKLGEPDFGLHAYQAGHIPGAALVDLEKDLSAPARPDRRGGRHPLADAMLADATEPCRLPNSAAWLESFQADKRIPTNQLLGTYTFRYSPETLRERLFTTR